jgi:dicarboxylate/amino acid:cation (Na+ or H+) symporter, DAACS family
MPLHTRILLGLVVGALAGGGARVVGGDGETLAWIVRNVAEPIGQAFLRMLFMIVVPLVVASLVLGVAQLGDISRVGRIGGKTLLFFLGTTTLAAMLGLVLVNAIRPGEWIDPAVRMALLEQFAPQAAEKVEAAKSSAFGIGTFVNIIPRNPVDAAARGDMLALIFFSLVFGIALTRIPREGSAPILRLLEGVLQAVTVVIGFAMKLAPLGVAALIFAVTARFGFDVLGSVAMYAVVVLLGLALHTFVGIPLLARAMVGISPLTFLRRSRGLMVTAFSTSSSSATLPTTIRTAEQEFGVPREVSGFVLPLGATMNMNGTALFEGITVLFLAQAFGIHLGLGSQAIVIGMAVITAIGAAGVPGGSIPLLVLVLEMVGIPGAAIALILGVDRLLDMSRTVPNVCGDLLTSLVVARSEGAALVPPPPDDDPTVVTPEEAAGIRIPEPVEAGAG